MSNYNEIVKLLNQKATLFDSYKAATQCAIDEDDDAKFNYITKREELANEIDGINTKIDACVKETKNERLSEAVRCSMDYAQLTTDEKPVYEAAQKSYALVAQISELNSQLDAVINARKQFYLLRIEETKNTPKIARYLKNVKINVDEPNFLSNKTT